MIGYVGLRLTFSMKGCVLVIWMALFHFNVIKGDDLSKVTEFDVKPGGETHVFEDTLVMTLSDDGHCCRIAYTGSVCRNLIG